ncbi:MAG: SecD/SecF family protein translocase subunit, partial [Planctomycetota bacterium]|nr:SecD/SecF family protein translocase subunit [Planctomycetota bacterium]
MRTPLLSRFLTIAFVLGLCLAAVLGRDLRLGKDLRGGVSLVYKVEIPEEEIDPQSVLDTTIEVLKARVNPQGIFDISIEGSGRDRIEVVMPLPGPETRALAAAWRTALDELVDSAEIRESEVLATLEEGEMGDLRGPDGSARATAFDALVAADAARKEAREAYNAVPEDAASTDRNLAAAAVADAEISFDDSLAALMELGLSGERVRRILSLPNKPILERDEEGRGRRDESGNPIFGPGQRDKAFASLQAEYPDLESALTKVQSAYDQYESQRTGFDDPEDLKRLLRGAGVLEFHIGVSSADPQGVDVAGLRRQLEELGAGNTQSPLASWYPINDLGQWYEKPAELAALTANPEGYFATTRDLVATRQDGIYYLLLRDDAGKALTASDDDWRLVRASEGQDRLGRPSINFALDQSGALRMGQLTGANKGRNMAIVLDSEVYSAPTIQSQISGNGQITGNFGAEEIAYLRKVLGAGSLSAQLSSEPISESVLGPSIGADNLERGTEAFLFALVVVAIFMGLWYFQAGLIADLALLANGLVIFGVLMGVDATFTLPGLAGIVLTVGMAVDANVLIFERIREELALGDVVLRQAVKNGYAKALSTILDGNITNLIVCG